MEKETYNSESIQVLEGLEAVRKRPGMYIGGLDSKGLHHLVWEIVDNSVDEVLAKEATQISLTMHADGSCTIEDDGRGIPVEIHSKTGVSALETVFTTLHAGGKFGGENSGYRVSGGLHGVGASVVNALSSYLHAYVKRNGKEYQLKFINGGKVENATSIIGESTSNGTKIKFLPDYELFNDGVDALDTDVIKTRLKETAYLNKGLIVNIIDEINDENIQFKFEGGLIDFVTDLNKNIEKITTDVIYNEGKENNIEVEVGIQYTTSYQPRVLSYVNNVATVEGGTHVKGFFDALLRIINNYAEKTLSAKEKQTFTREDIKEGIVAVISIKHPDPIYEGQTKGKLANVEVRKIVNKIISEKFEKYLLENPSQAGQILYKVKLAAKSRIAAMKAKEITRKKDALDFSTLPGKLSDCSSKDRNSTELFIVEGDSAGGSAKMGRNRENQAILPLRGKVINAEKARIDKLFANNEITSLITAIGTGISEEFNLEKLRYGKIIIMTDADVDGAHIKTLLLTFFYRYFVELIQNGNVFIACPPLFRIGKGSKAKYVYSEKEKNEVLETLGEKVQIQRYKGLGEMNADQLWDTTMDPQKRKLLKVTIDDLSRADLVFTNLMGEIVEPRRDFIYKNATFAKLDL